MESFSNHPLYRRHNIDSALSSLWNFYKQNFLALFIVSLVMSAITQYASTLVNMQELATITDPILMLEKMKSFIVPMLLISLISLLATTILQYYIIYNPVDKENSTMIMSLVKSLKYFLPYLIIMVLLGFVAVIAVTIGIIALIIGAFFAILYIVTLYLFILPIMMVEGMNIGNVIARTIKLAHRNFWSNIGWVAVMLIIMIVVSLVLSSVVLLPFAGNFIKSIVHPEDMVNVTSNPLFIGLSAVVGALTIPVMPIFGCILYFNGRSYEDQQVNQEEPKTPEEYKVRVEDLYAKPYSEDHPDNPENKS
jgi:hypothetical protein